MKWKYSILFFLFPVIFPACTVDETTLAEEIFSPTITFDEESGYYTVKVNNPITVTAIVEFADDPVYSWKYEGEIVSRELHYTFQSKESGKYYHTFRVDARNGSGEEEICIEVVELTPPVIDLPVGEGILTVVAGEDLELIPVVKFSEGATYSWRVNGKEVSTESSYTFNETVLADYAVSLTVTNEDGTSQKECMIRVTDPPTLSITFESETLSVPVGRSLTIAPYIAYSNGQTRYSWRVDGVLQSESSEIFLFTPATEDSYLIEVTGTEEGTEVTASLVVACVAAEGTYYREATDQSLAFSNKVYEYLPAPGQFINEGYNAYTLEQANEFAENQLAEIKFVCLGAFGGYIVVGFDHSIRNIPGEYDFAVYGNAFSGSSEPGIVYVMQDENGNGLPDDTWYELRGSETGKESTLQNYAVTYYKPSAPAMNVQWVDNYGNQGTVDYNSYHAQTYYYPNWVTTHSYTLRGTRLASRIYSLDGQIVNGDFDWGYADNNGTDAEDKNNIKANVNGNYFSIENAMHANGEPVKLSYIDFIKVQTGVNAKAGWLGEV
ncbi:MAG: cell surface protein, partial [Bacteroides sp.]|nr:cell surface protein [Bacteroides sp.]